MQCFSWPPLPWPALWEILGVAAGLILLILSWCLRLGTASCQLVTPGKSNLKIGTERCQRIASYQWHPLNLNQALPEDRANLRILPSQTPQTQAHVNSSILVLPSCPRPCTFADTLQHSICRAEGPGQGEGMRKCQSRSILIQGQVRREEETQDVAHNAQGPRTQRAKL